VWRLLPPTARSCCSLFVAVVLNGIPLDAVVAQTGMTRNSIYKAIFDARRKIRAFLVANGYLEHRRLRSR
jgi:RNA polymerase sigma-70 factor, ECF subfamily